MIIYDRANDKMIEVVPKSYGLLKQFNGLVTLHRSYLQDTPHYQRSVYAWGSIVVE